METRQVVVHGGSVSLVRVVPNMSPVDVIRATSGAIVVYGHGHVRRVVHIHVVRIDHVHIAVVFQQQQQHEHEK